MKIKYLGLKVAIILTTIMLEMVSSLRDLATRAQSSFMSTADSRLRAGGFVAIDYER